MTLPVVSSFTRGNLVATTCFPYTMAHDGELVAIQVTSSNTRLEVASQARLDSF